MGEGDCIFCKIANGEIPASILNDADGVLAFRDIDPKAPTHVLVIPRRHIGSLNDTGESDQALLGRMVLAARGIAHSEGLAEAGYRIVMNTGGHGGQSVDHIHIHVLGGRSLSWPPG